MPSKTLVDKIRDVTSGELSTLGILADFYPHLESEFHGELMVRIREVFRGEAKSDVDRDQSATTLPLSAADQDSTKGDRNNDVSDVSTDQSVYEIQYDRRTNKKQRPLVRRCR